LDERGPAVGDEETTGLPSGIDLQRWVRISRRLEAPPERVFRAWADPEELARWLPEHIDGGLAVGSRSSLVWPDQRVWWEVVEARSPGTFVFRRPWLPDERLVTKVDVTIEPVGYGSRVRLEDGPFPLDQPGVIEAWTVALEHWSEAIAMLRAHLDFSVDLRRRE
jgi:uncharacterized protein YndB with AHSA1/START domain